MALQGIRLNCAGRTAPGRHAINVSWLEHCAVRKASAVIVCMGRNDGASGKKRRSNSRSHQRRISGPEADDGLWFERDVGDGPSSSGSASSSVERLPIQEPASARPSARHGSAGVRQGRRTRVDEEEEDEEDTRGWWQRPEERSLQAYAAPSLQAWQEERLQLAYATGRRKVQILELARELDVDRSVVLAWFKEFSLRPQKERDAIIAPRLAEERQRQAEKAAREAAQAEAEAANPGGRGGAVEARGAAASSSAAGGAKAAKPGQGEAPFGFVPFYLRKQMGEGKQRRISGEVLRTLESIYDRTPFPSADVVRGLFELHRLPRDAAIEWFASRRAADGISSSTQKRVGRPSQRVKDRELDGAFSGGLEGPGRDDPESSGLLGTLGGTGTGSAGGPQGAAQQQPAEPTVVKLRPRDMAALRSSMPSPNKHKGRQLAEQMNIKTGPDSPITQIGSIQYVQEAPSAPLGERVRAAWRFRAASPAAVGAPTGAAAGGKKLRLRGRGADSGGGGSGKADVWEAASDADEDMVL